MTYLHTNCKMPNSNVSLVITIKHRDNKIFMLQPCYMTFCRTTNDSMQTALRFYVSAKVQLVITYLGYDTVFIGSPLPLIFQVYQQDATLYNILYYCQCSTCFRRFLRPSSGAQNCTPSIWYMSSLLA